MFSHYQRLIALRHDLPVVSRADFTMLLRDDEHVYAFTRRLDDVELLVLANFSACAATVDLPGAQAWAQADLLLLNYPGPPGVAAPADLAGPADVASPAGEPVKLRPWEVRVHRRVRR